MNKRRFGRKLGRGRGSRKALFRSITKALVEHGSIVTTRVKAKAFQGEIEKLIGLAKEGSLNSRRRVYAKLGNDRKTTDKIFIQISKAFKDRSGGYTRIVNLPTRRGDNAEMVRLQWTEDIGERKLKAKNAVESKKKPVAKSALSRLKGGKKKTDASSKKPVKKLNKK